MDQTVSTETVKKILLLLTHPTKKNKNPQGVKKMIEATNSAQEDFLVIYFSLSVSEQNIPRLQRPDTGLLLYSSS